MIKIGKKPRQLADRFDAIDTGLRPSRTEGRGETTGRPVRFRVRPSSSLPAPLRSGTGFVPSPEPSLRGAVRSSPVAPLVPRAAPPSPGRRKRLPLRGFLKLFARSGTCFAPAPLRSGTGFVPRRSLRFAEPPLCGAFASPEPPLAPSTEFRLRRHRLRSGTGSFLPGALSMPEPSPAAHVIRLTFLNRGQITNC